MRNHFLSPRLSEGHILAPHQGKKISAWIASAAQPQKVVGTKVLDEWFTVVVSLPPNTQTMVPFQIGAECVAGGKEAAGAGNKMP